MPQGLPWLPVQGSELRSSVQAPARTAGAHPAAAPGLVVLKTYMCGGGAPSERCHTTQMHIVSVVRSRQRANITTMLDQHMLSDLHMLT